MSTETPKPVTDELLLKFATALGDALFDFSIAIGRAVDIIRPDLASEVSRDISPSDPAATLYELNLRAERAARACENHNIDAGGNCRACGYNSDVAYSEAVMRGEDVYGDVPPTYAEALAVRNAPELGWVTGPKPCNRPECRRCHP